MFLTQTTGVFCAKKSTFLRFKVNGRIERSIGLSKRFDNPIERSVRPVKTKMKVSGQFETIEGAQVYANLYSIVQTARKKGDNPFEALVQIANSIV